MGRKLPSQYPNDHFQLRLLFQLSGSVFPRAFVQAAPSAAAAAAIHIYYGTDDEGLRSAGSSFAPVLGSYTFVLGFLVVFRTQLAYARYWEGATLLSLIRGQWYNAISSIFAFCTNKPEHAKQVADFKHMMVRLMSMLHCSALVEISDMADTTFEVIVPEGIDPDALRFLDTFEKDTSSTSSAREVSVPMMIILQWIQRLIIENQTKSEVPEGKAVIIVAPGPIVSRVFHELAQGIHNVANAGKLHSVPFPFPYAQMLSRSIWYNSSKSRIRGLRHGHYQRCRHHP